MDPSASLSMMFLSDPLDALSTVGPSAEAL